MEKKYLDIINPLETKLSVDRDFGETRESIARDLRDHHVDRIVLSPTRWKKYNNKTPLVWSMVKYDKSQKSNIPDNKGGVYTFVVMPGIGNHPHCSFLLYVGKTERQTLRERFLQYFGEEKRKGGRIHIQAMLGNWKEYLWFCFATIDDENNIESVEDDLISAFVPPFNRVFKGILKEGVAAWRI